MDTPAEMIVAILVPSNGACTAEFTQSLTVASAYLQKYQPHVEQRFYFNNGSVIAENRLGLAKIAMKDGADWTVWFDSDMRFPKDTIERLLSWQKPIVAASYPTRRLPVIEPTAFADDESQERIYTEDGSQGLQPAAAVGFGAIAIHAGVYAKMPQPWFFSPWDEAAGKYDCGEDVYFCRKARTAGFQILIDHALSREVKHVGAMEYGYREALALRGRIAELKPGLLVNRVTRGNAA